jgi:hypothetical protein
LQNNKVQLNNTKLEGGGEQLVVRAAADGTWCAGQALSLGAAPGRVHVFGEDGKRLEPAAS